MTATKMKRPPQTTFAKLLQPGDVIANTWAYYQVTAVEIRGNYVWVDVNVQGGGEHYPKTLRPTYRLNERVTLSIHDSKRWVEYRKAQREAFLAAQS
jgi:hypothetical protein